MSNSKAVSRSTKEEYDGIIVQNPQNGARLTWRVAFSKLGISGWSWNEILPYFKEVRLQNIVYHLINQNLWSLYSLRNSLLQKTHNGEPMSRSTSPSMAPLVLLMLHSQPKSQLHMSTLSRPWMRLVLRRTPIRCVSLTNEPVACVLNQKLRAQEITVASGQAGLLLTPLPILVSLLIR